MKRKTFIIIILCCILLPTSFFGACALSYNSGFETGKKLYASSDSLSRTGLFMTNKTSFEAGYQAGLKAAQSGVTPSP